MKAYDYSNLYEIVKLAEEQKETLDLEQVKSRLNDQMRIRVVPEGERIFRMEDRKNYVYFIMKGSFFNYRMSTNGKMNIFGSEKAPQWNGIDRALQVANLNYTENKTLEECVVLEIRKDYFVKAVEANGKFGCYLLKKVLYRMSSISGKSDRLLFHDANEKLVYFILRYWDERHKDTKPCKIEKKNAEVAEEIGMNVRSLYRAQSALKREELITVQDGNVVVTAEQVRRMKAKYPYFEPLAEFYLSSFGV